MHLQMNETIFHNWKIKKVIGEGSFGVVYEIEREEFGRVYKAAAKVISIPKDEYDYRDVLDDDMTEENVTAYYRSLVDDIIGECDLMERMKGDSHIVSYEDHHVVKEDDGLKWTIYIRMELLTPLVSFIKERKLKEKDIVQLGIDICSGLETCQKFNVIHRDIKPENIFISDTNNYKLGDFGISKALERSEMAVSKKGTQLYMAPEVYRGEQYDATVDIYSLGLVLFRLMNNNRAPFLPPAPEMIYYQDKEMALHRRLKGEAIPSPCNASDEFGRVIQKACSFLPEDRYQTPREMRRELEAVLLELENDTEKPIDEEINAVDVHGLELEDSGGTLGVAGKFVKRSMKDEEIRLKAEEERKQKEKEERRLAEEAKQREEERRRIEEEKRRQEEARRLEELERQRREAEEKRKREEEEKRKREEEEQRKREEEEKRKREEEAKRIAELEARKKAEEEAKRLEEEKRRLAEKEAKRLEEEKRRLAEKEAKRLEEEKRRLAEKEAQRKAEIEARRKAEEEARLRLKTQEDLNVLEEQIVASTNKTPTITSVPNKQNVKIPSKSKKSKAPIFVCLVLGIAVCGWFFGTTKVPDITGVSEAEAKLMLDEAQLTYQMEQTMYSDDVALGCIISQNKQPGKRVLKNSKILVNISAGAEQVTLPDLVNGSLEEAEKAISSLTNVKLDVQYAYCTTIEKDKICAHSPIANEILKSNSTLVVYISQGPGVMPNVIGTVKDTAMADLAALGMKVAVEEVYDDKAEAGLVVNQSIPEGEAIGMGMEITLQVSKGVEMISVPSVIGLTKDEAISKLQEAGFKKKKIEVVEEYNNDVEAGKVISQNVEPDAKVEKGNSIIIYVSLGAKPTQNTYVPSNNTKPTPKKDDSGWGSVEVVD